MENQLLKDIVNTSIKDLVELRLKIVRYLTLFEFLPLIISIILSTFLDNRIMISIFFVFSILFILISDYLLFKIFHKSKISKLFLDKKELFLIEIIGFNYPDINTTQIQELIVKYIIKNTNDILFNDLKNDLIKMVDNHMDKNKLINLINYRDKRL